MNAFGAHDAARPPISTTLRTRELRWFVPLYSLCIIAMSLMTMSAASGTSDHHFWLAAFEIVGAAALMTRRTRYWGTGLLLTVFCVAIIATISAGHFPIPLVLFAMTAVFIARVSRGV